MYRKGISPDGVNDAQTPRNNLDSIESVVCSRSGASGDSLSTSDTNLPQANCNKIIESKIIIVKQKLTKFSVQSTLFKIIFF